MTGPGGVSSLIHLTSSPKTTRTLVVAIGGSTANFIEGIEVNQRYPHQGEKNDHMLQPLDTAWR